MEHRVAVRTDGQKVGNWINLVILTNFGQGNEMVDVNKTFANLPISTFKIEAADRAIGPVVSQACLASPRIPFIGIHGDSPQRPFLIPLRR